MNASVTLRTASPSDVAGDPPAHHGQPRGRPSAAREHRGRRARTSRASSSPAIDDAVVGCAELAPLSPRSPKCARSSSTRRSAAGTSARTSSSRRRRRRATASGFSTLCAFTHEPSHFVRLGFTIVPHIWVPEKIAHDCTWLRALPPLRPVRGDAAAARRRHDRPGAAGGDHSRHALDDRPDGWRCGRWSTSTRGDSGVTGIASESTSRSSRSRAASPRRAASAPPASPAASRRAASSTCRCSSPTTRRAPPASSRPTSRRRRRCCCRASTSRSPAAAAARSSSTAAAPTPAPAPTAAITRALMADCTAARGRLRRRSTVLVASTGVIGVKLTMANVERGIADAASQLSPRRRRRRGARDHDDRSVPEGSARSKSSARRAIVPRRRHGQGLGHDRAADGDDARRS